MDAGQLLVAEVSADSVGDLGWLADVGQPYRAEDPLDFIDSEAAQRTFELYHSVYSQIDPDLNVPSESGLVEYNRWVLVLSGDGNLVGFALFKTTPAGLKLGLIGSDGSDAGRGAAKLIAREALNQEGVFAEVSDPLESALLGHVPEVDPARAQEILQKQVELDADGRHYFRVIENVGERRKLLVGKPLVG